MNKYWKIFSILIIIISIIFILGLKRNILIKEENTEPIYVAGIINHHLLAKDIIDKFFKELSKFKYDNIVLLSPDHFNSCSLYGKSFLFKEDSQLAIDKDHGIGNLLPTIKQIWPMANIIPVLVCDKEGNLPDGILESKNTLVIASVDFSHYLPERLMNLHDDKSISDISNFIKDLSIDVDCPRCVKIVNDFAANKKAINILEIGRSNSFLYNKSNDPKDGTSYYSVIFSKASTSFQAKKSKTFLFVGDMMLARGVRARIDEKGFDYLLGNAREAFNGVDYVIGNLEGPIVQDAPAVPNNSLSFSFDEDVINFLNKYKFDILSLANNHTNNYNGKEGYNSTVKLLKENSIDYIGHYSSCEKSYSYNNDGNYFIAFNLTFGDNGCSKTILKNIEDIKKENPNSFIILYPHWGEEYKTTSNSFQQKLAHKFIDAGANLIIGSHPHVVQEVELYKNKLIFYSLGNFIFDQYFSKETQQGLMIGLNKENAKLIYYIIPLSEQRSSVNFFNNEESRNFLKDLAKRSSKDLTIMIEGGKIELTNN